MTGSSSIDRQLKPSNPRTASPPVFDPLFPATDLANAQTVQELGSRVEQVFRSMSESSPKDDETFSHIPAQGGSYDLGTEDRPWRNVATRGVSVRGTQTVQDGVLRMYRGSVLEFEKNYSLVVLPVYDQGTSPYDYWHPSSSYYRDGGFWIQKGSPARLMVRAMGQDRMVGHWDTATCTKAGSILWERTCDNKVRLSTTQFDDTEDLEVEVDVTASLASAHFRDVPWFDVKHSDFGAVGDGTTDDTAAIEAALAAASAVNTDWGSVVYFPPGNYKISNPLVLPNRCTIRGTTEFNSRITADATNFATGTCMIMLGDSMVFHCRVESLLIDCNHVEGSTGIYSKWCQELSGVFNCWVGYWGKYGIHFETGSSLCDIDGVYMVTLNKDGRAEHGIHLDGVNGQCSVKRVSTGYGDMAVEDATNASPIVVEVSTPHGLSTGDYVGLGGVKGNTAANGTWTVTVVDSTHFSLDGSTGDGAYVSGGHGLLYGVGGIYVNSGNVNLERIHIERMEHGIYFAAGTGGQARSIYGHNSLSNVVTLAGAANVSLFDIVANHSESDKNILKDDYRSAEYAASDLGIISSYDHYEMRVGATSLRDLTNDDLQTITMPDLAGGSDELTTAQCTQELVNKAVYSPYLRSGGQTADQRLQLLNAAQSTSGANLEFPDLDSSTKREVLVNVAGAWQEARTLRLVDLPIKRNGQTGQFARLSSADQSDTGTVYLPDLGGTQQTPAFLGLDQTFTGTCTFTSGVHIPNGPFTIPVLSSDPGSPVEGQLWWNSSDSALRLYDGSSVHDIYA